MAITNELCKVCGKYAKFDSSQYSKDITSVKPIYYCSRACRDYDKWGFKAVVGLLMIVMGWIFLLAASTDVLFAYLGFPMFIGGFAILGWGIQIRRAWLIYTKDENEIEDETLIGDIIDLEELN